MKQLNFLLLAFSILLTAQLQGQTRYLDEVFSNVNVETDVIYGTNISVVTGSPMASNLLMDVYTPVGDDATERPVVIYLHTGSFLPQYFSRQITGGKQDSTAVEICKRLAKRGYVAVSATYRAGWAPEADDQNVRTSTLLQAAYRGIIDTRTCIRYLRKTIAEDGNPYGIDGDKIVLWGQGTGGYLSYGAGTLDRYEEVVLDKFINTVTLQPYVIEAIDGNVYGTNETPLNIPNYVEYSSDFQIAVNMGGALGDISWVEGANSTAPEPVFIGFHLPTDPFAPFGNGPVIVPTTQEFVVNVSGTRTATEAANDLGSNDKLAPVLGQTTGLGAYLNAVINALKPVPFQFPGQEPTTLGEDNIYPFISPGFRVESGPWEWWSKPQLDATIAAVNQVFGTNFNSDTLHYTGLLTNPDMSAEKARAYIDTIMAYYIPRACVTFGFEECSNALGVVGTEEVLDAKQVGLMMGPNPAAEAVSFQTHADFPMKEIRLFSTQGLLVKSYLGIKDNSYTLNRGELPPGMYIAIVHFEDGMVIRKIVFD
ncbi:MAG: T9SS type A sorting domain-containing protein [Lewinellaceae bacterium]|nr:T9SS type A sorting domain-containing protein [Lewinellaceae bacterium]